jgi:hypothetical protein
VEVFAGPAVGNVEIVVHGDSVSPVGVEGQGEAGRGGVDIWSEGADRRQRAADESGREKISNADHGHGFR